MDLRPKFRVRAGYVILAGTEDSRRVNNMRVNKTTAMPTARRHFCPSPEQVMASSRLEVRKLDGNLDDKVFSYFCSIRLADDLLII